MPDADAIYVIGHLNSGIADNKDCIPVPKQIGLDMHDNLNKYGESLIDILKDTKMCLLISRVIPEHDNFTCIYTRRK